MKSFKTKYLLVVFLIIQTVCAAPAPDTFKNKFYGKSYALIVGINDYSSPKWPKLDSAIKGADAFKTMLENHNFVIEHLYDANASKTNILAKVDEIMAKAKKEDRFIFYFAGHGARDQSKVNGYLVPQSGNDYPDYIPLVDIVNLAKKVDAKHQLYILDACYAGFIKTRGGPGMNTKDPLYLQKATSEIARMAITSGGKNEKVLDSGGPNGHSPFTGHFLMGIQKGVADGNGDGYVTLSEIHNYLLPNASNYESTPSKTTLPGDDDGMFVFLSEIGATKKFKIVKTGGKTRSKAKKGIENPFLEKTEKIQYSKQLSAADWMAKGDEAEFFEDAIVYYTNAINLYPHFKEAYYNRAIEYEDQGDATIEELDDDESNDAEIRTSFSNAIKDYKKVLEFDPYDVDCLFNMGALYYELENYEEALSAFNRAIEIDPEDTYSYTFRGDVYLEQERDDLAFADYKKALQIDPEDGYLYYDRGDAYIVIKEYDLAIDDFTQAITLYPDEADFYEARSVAYEELEMYDMADDDKRKADQLFDEVED